MVRRLGVRGRPKMDIVRQIVMGASNYGKVVIETGMMSTRVSKGRGDLDRQGGDRTKPPPVRGSPENTSL